MEAGTWSPPPAFVQESEASSPDLQDGTDLAPSGSQATAASLLDPPQGPQLPEQDHSREIDSHHWVRIHNGVLQVKVLLQGLPTSDKYNGCTGWISQEQLLDHKSDSKQPRLLTVYLTNPERVVQVNSLYVFPLGPQCEACLPRSQLFTLTLRLHTPRGLIPIRALVDTGCELEGILNRQLAQQLGIQLQPSTQSIRTANGQTVTGIEHALVKTHFAPGCTRSVRYGALELPGVDAVLGMPFLERCSPFHLGRDSSGERTLHLTWPGSGKSLVFASAVAGPLQVADQLESVDHLAADSVPAQDDVPISTEALCMQWEPPSAADYQQTIAVFRIHQPVESPSPLLQWTSHPQLGQDPTLDSQLAFSDRSSGLQLGHELPSMEAEEGLIFQSGVNPGSSLAHVPASIREDFRTLIQKYRSSIFKEQEFPPFPPNRDVKFHIQLEEGAQIPASPVRKLSPALVEQLRTMLQELLRDGLIVPSTSPFAAPLLMIKKPDGSYRICIDYRKLNAVTIKDRYPLPNPNMIFDKLAGCRFFSKLDLRWAYYQVQVADEDVHKTTFRSPLGSFASRVMSMGLTNAAPTFQRLMDSILGDLDFVSCYLDDVLIYSRSVEEHLSHVSRVLERLHQHRLIARESKCSFFLTEIQFLGFVFSQQGRAVDSSKTAALCLLPPPDTVHELQRWLGAVNYCSPFILRFADLTAPLTDLLRGVPKKSQRKSKAKLNWSPIHQESFEAIRAALAKPPLLRLFDPSLPCIVSADSSRSALGGVLEQEENGIRRPVAYYSRKLSPAKQRYTTRERECLAVKQCLLVWRHYLLGAPFTVRSDHESLKWLQTQNVDTLSDRLLRWLEYLSLFDFKQEYIPGEHNVFPDHLSRPAEHRPATQVILGSGELNQEQPDFPAFVNLLLID